MSEERKMIYLCLAHMSEEGLEQKYVKEAFDTNWVVPMGPSVNAFEKDLEAFVNSKSDDSAALDRHVVCLSAGTAAVHLALIGCGVGPGDEVLVQSFTFCASSHLITYLGAKPVFVGSERAGDLEYGSGSAGASNPGSKGADRTIPQGDRPRSALWYALPDR